MFPSLNYTFIYTYLLLLTTNNTLIHTAGNGDIEMSEGGANGVDQKLKSLWKGGDKDDVKNESGMSDSINKWLTNYFIGTTGQNIKIFTQTCTLTFLAEWGDRSQIATVALAASKNVFGVVIGGLVGHALCTGVAVIGGRMLAAKISEKHVVSNRSQDGWLNLSEYVRHVAERNGKLVNLVVSGINEINVMPEYNQALKEICIQLLRNAVVHGIEAPSDRELSEKPLAGRIDLRLAKISDYEMEIVVMDDGAGLDYDAIRNKAINSGRWS